LRARWCQQWCQRLPEKRAANVIQMACTIFGVVTIVTVTSSLSVLDASEILVTL
jgi:hypothetical protein